MTVPALTSERRELRIQVSDGYVTAYAHAVDDAGMRSMDGYGCQGRIRSAVEDGVRQLLEEFLAGGR